MRVSAELRDHDAAGSLAEELPYWGWLEDGRTCLTRSGELIAAGRLAPAVVDGHSPEQIDRVLGGFPPAPEAIKPSPWFLRMPVLHGPPQVLGLTQDVVPLLGAGHRNDPNGESPIWD